MNNLKFIIPVIILFILLVTGIYYYYRTQVSNISDLNLNIQPSPVTGFKAATPSATPKTTAQANGQGSMSSQPRTGPEGEISLSTTIAISSPAQASTISSPVQIKGFANITSQVVEIKIKDSNDNIIGSGKASACIGYTACEFNANIVFSKPQTSTGTIEAFAKSTIDGSPADVTTLGVNFN